MDEFPNPITRSEQYLAKIAGEDVSLPEPITREEIYLNAIANNGGGGGGGIFAVTTTANMDAGTFTTASATAGEIRTAAGSGQLPVLVVVMGDTGSMMIAHLTMTSAQFAQFISEDKLFGVDAQGAVTMS